MLNLIVVNSLHTKCFYGSSRITNVFSWCIFNCSTSLSGNVPEETPISTLRTSLTSWLWQSSGSGRSGDGVCVDRMFLISPSHSRYSWSNASLPASVRYGGSFWPGGLKDTERERGWQMWTMSKLLWTSQQGAIQCIVLICFKQTVHPKILISVRIYWPSFSSKPVDFLYPVKQTHKKINILNNVDNKTVLFPIVWSKNIMGTKTFVTNFLQNQTFSFVLHRRKSVRFVTTLG